MAFFNVDAEIVDAEIWHRHTHTVDTFHRNSSLFALFFLSFSSLLFALFFLSSFSPFPLLFLSNISLY